MGGHDPGVCAQITGAWAELLLAFPDKALASIAEALALAERIAHPFTLGLALLNSSLVYLNRREPERALRQLDAAEALAAEQRLSLIYEPGMLRGAASARTRCRRRSHRPHSRGRSEMDPARAHFQFALWFGVPGRGFGAARRSGGGTGRIAGGIGNSGRHRRAYVGCGTAPPYRDCAARRKQARRGPGLPAASDPHRPSPTSEIAGIARRPRASPGCGASRAGAPKPAISSRRSTAGSPRASTPPI